MIEHRGTMMCSRAGTYATFDRRYKPIPLPDHSICRDWYDPIFKNADEHLVWTIVQGDTGRLYLTPGYATVNYIARVLCEKPWPDDEITKPGYVY